MMTRRAWRKPQWVASMPRRGGPARNAVAEMVATAAVRWAARGGSSLAADMPIGNVSAEAPPQIAAPRNASGSQGARPKIPRPAIAASALRRTVATLPHRSISFVPSRRTLVMTPRKRARPVIPAAS